ncbi:hypothetical protein V5O48_007886 [Marasmius crinis-equi]|uniref:Uncharacterized protein n=1 Tax=Marasmius crinis-equi TaxID=585013 RepID=A0ABR3FFF6_9AGAR
MSITNTYNSSTSSTSPENTDPERNNTNPNSNNPNATNTGSSDSNWQPKWEEPPPSAPGYNRETGEFETEFLTSGEFVRKQ